MVYAGNGYWACPKCSRLIQTGFDMFHVQEQAEPEAPRGLDVAETLWVLRNTPHPTYKRPPEVLAAFDRFWQRIDTEPEDEDSEVIRDASSQHDKYIYE
jgi:hypothetical protein